MAQRMIRKRLCLVTSVPFYVEVFLLDQVAQLSRQYDVTLAVNTNRLDFLQKLGIEANVVAAPIERRISPFRDLQALLFLIRMFRTRSFDLVHSTTPKAGLLSMVAARLTGVPVRIHTFTGQVWGSRAGLMRWLLRLADRIIAASATHILVDSFSQRDFLIKEGIVTAAKSRVLARGSISGVKIDRYRPDPTARIAIRDKYGIPRDALVFLFMARLTRDKGALAMAAGFNEFSRLYDKAAHLIVVGPDEEELRPRMAAICSDCAARLHFEEYTKVPEQYMNAADIFCLPSYREGFGTVLINAAAAGLPAIASRIYGSEEAIQEHVTGLLHEAGNSLELAEKMQTLARDPELRARLGENAGRRARDDFSEAAVTGALLTFYASVLVQ